jgi:hypothetical protein
MPKKSFFDQLHAFSYCHKNAPMMGIKKRKFFCRFKKKRTPQDQYSDLQIFSFIEFFSADFPSQLLEDFSRLKGLSNDS